MRRALALLAIACLPTLASAQEAAPAAGSALRLDRLLVQRQIEWAGDNLMVELSLTAQADGSYRASFAGERLQARQDVRLEAGDLAEVFQALLALDWVGPDDSFAGDGNHWFTVLDASGTREGQPFRLVNRRLYDASSDRVMSQINALEDAITRLAERVAAASQATPTPGLAGALGH